MTHAKTKSSRRSDGDGRAPGTPTQTPTLWTRRDALTRTGWVMVLGSAGAAMVGAIRMLFPRVSFAPPATVTLGHPEDFAVGQVADKWKKSHQLMLVREEEGFYALRAVCTHLGCIPNWSSSREMFRCPCHGSTFAVGGRNLEGPAPRPLERYAIFLDDAGRIVVDTAVQLREERGEWNRDDAYLAYPATKDDGIS